jgi:HPt (histidine-containing phosphotransfer) domain-containing protein
MPGDAERAASLFERALGAAEALGMTALAEKCRKLELELSGPATRRL